MDFKAFRAKFAFVAQQTKLTPFKQFLISAKHLTKCYENVLKCYFGNYFSRKGLLLCIDICKGLRRWLLTRRQEGLSVPNLWNRLFLVAFNG